MSVQTFTYVLWELEIKKWHNGWDISWNTSLCSGSKRLHSSESKYWVKPENREKIGHKKVWFVIIWEYMFIPCLTCYFYFVTWNIYRPITNTVITNTVELRWLELEGTVKICSSYRKFEPPRSRNFREKKIRFWPGTVSLRYDNWCTVKWAFLVKKYLIL